MTHPQSYKKSPLVVIPYIFLLLILWIISGWNTKNGDLDNYETLYGYNFSSDLLENLDVGFMYILSVFKDFDFSFQQFHIYIYLFYIGFIGWFIYNFSKRPILALSIYILLFFFRDCITLRNSLADIFLLLGLYAYTDKNLKFRNIYYILGILLAGSIHISFLAFLILLFCDIKIEYKWTLGLSLILAYAAHGILASIVSVGALSNNVGFQNKYQDYLESSSWFTPIMASITLLLNYFLIKKSLNIKENNERSVEDFRMQKLLNISNILFSIIIFTSISMVSMRYFYNFFMFAYIFIYNRLYCENIHFCKKLKQARILFLLSILWVFLWLVCFSNISANIPVILSNNNF